MSTGKISTNPREDDGSKLEAGSPILGREC